MIKQSMQDAINDQINKELFSAYIYLAMAAHFESKNLPGFSRWLRLQSEEELEHAMKFYRYLQERGGEVVLKSIDQPQAHWDTALLAFKDVLAHEQFITTSINKLYEMALKENDYPSQMMLQWFINEQVEEEANATLIVEQLKMIEERENSMLFLDNQLGKRETE